jgi:hypothetical protein
MVEISGLGTRSLFANPGAGLPDILRAIMSEVSLQLQALSGLTGDEPIGISARRADFFVSGLVVQHYFPGLHVHRICCT